MLTKQMAHSITGRHDWEWDLSILCVHSETIGPSGYQSLCVHIGCRWSLKCILLLCIHWRERHCSWWILGHVIIEKEMLSILEGWKMDIPKAAVRGRGWNCFEPCRDSCCSLSMSKVQEGWCGNVFSLLKESVGINQVITAQNLLSVTVEKKSCGTGLMCTCTGRITLLRRDLIWSSWLFFRRGNKSWV